MPNNRDQLDTLKSTDAKQRIRIQELEIEISRYFNDLDHIRSERDTFRNEVAKLRMDSAKLAVELAELRNKCDTLSSAHEDFKRSNVPGAEPLVIPKLTEAIPELGPFNGIYVEDKRSTKKVVRKTARKDAPKKQAKTATASITDQSAIGEKDYFLHDNQMSGGWTIPVPSEAGPSGVHRTVRQTARKSTGARMRPIVTMKRT